MLSPVTVLLVAVAISIARVSAQSTPPIERILQYVQRPYYDRIDYASDVLDQSPAPFIDLSTLPGATVSTVTADDDAFQTITVQSFLPTLFGHRHREVQISSNGFVSTIVENCAPEITFCNWGYRDPTDVYYRRYLAPLMADFNPPAGQPTARVLYYEDTGAKRLYVTWHKLMLWEYRPQNETIPSPAYQDAWTFTVQLVLMENGDVQFNYKRVPFNPLLATHWTSNEKYPLAFGLRNAIDFISIQGDVFSERTNPLSYNTLIGLVRNGQSQTTLVNNTAIGTDALNGGPGSTAPAGYDRGVSVLYRARPTCASRAQQTNCSTCIGFSNSKLPADPDYLDCSYCLGSAHSIGVVSGDGPLANYCFDQWQDENGVQQSCPDSTNVAAQTQTPLPLTITHNAGLCANRPTDDSLNGGSGDGGLSGPLKGATIGLSILAFVLLIVLGVGIYRYRQQAILASGGQHAQLADRPGGSVPVNTPPVVTAVIGEHSQIRERQPSISDTRSGGDAAASTEKTLANASGAALQPQSEPSAGTASGVNAERSHPSTVASAAPGDAFSGAQPVVVSAQFRPAGAIAPPVTSIEMGDVR